MLKFSCHSQIRVGSTMLILLNCGSYMNYVSMDNIFKATTLNIIGLQAFTATVDQLAFFCFSTPCGRYVFRRFGGTHCLHLQSDNPVHVDVKVVGNVSVIWENWRNSGP